MIENSQDRWCVSLAARGTTIAAKRSLALASILQSFAPAEIANALHLRDFLSPAIFEFFNTIEGTTDVPCKRGHFRVCPNSGIAFFSPVVCRFNHWVS